MSRSRSLRTLIPLSLALSALLTALVLGAIFAQQEYRNASRSLITTALQLGHAMTIPLATAIKHNDVWSAYTHLKGPRTVGDTDYTMIVMDHDTGILASNRPRFLRTGVPLYSVSPAFRTLAEGVVAQPAHTDSVHRLDDLDTTFVLIPLALDGDAIGWLAIGFEDGAILARFRGIAGRAALAVAIVVPLLAIGGLLWGRRLVRPLVKLEHDMSRIEAGNLHAVNIDPPTDDNEIGRLGRRFHRMIERLRHQDALEKQMVNSERLAAIGRLAAGVAHEINNPLGGMLLAIDTWREHDPSPEQAAKTLALIERGLQQIQQTVGALLVESRIIKRPFSRQDLNDIRTLVAHSALKQGTAITYDNDLPDQVDLPAPLLRQLLINLILNAVQATPRGEGRVDCRLRIADRSLAIDIGNNGPAIPEQARTHIFEPFWTTREEGIGLGLWMSWQIVDQLKGHISFETEDGLTTFHVSIPIPEQDHADERS